MINAIRAKKFVKLLKEKCKRMSQLLRIMIIKKLTSVVCLYTDFDDLDVFRITFQLCGGVIVDYSSSDLQYPDGKATSSDR